MIDAASDSVFCFLLHCVVWVCEHWLYICGCREKFIRLQHENKMLRVQQEEYEREKITALQEQLEEAHKTRSELDTENRWTEPISLPRSPTDRGDGDSLLFSSVKFYIVLNSFLKCILLLFSCQTESRADHWAAAAGRGSPEGSAESGGQTWWCECARATGTNTEKISHRVTVVRLHRLRDEWNYGRKSHLFLFSVKMFNWLRANFFNLFILLL